MPTFKARISLALAVVFGAAALLPAVSFAAPAPKKTTKPSETKSAKPAPKPAPKTAAPSVITHKSPANTVVAVVNGENILKADLDEAIWTRYANQTLSDLVDRVAIRQAANKMGVKLTKKDLDEKVNEFKQKLPPGTTFESFLKQWNLTEQQLRKEMETQLYVEKAAARAVKVTDQDLAGYVKVRHILLSTKGATPEERTKSEEENKAKIEQIAKDINEGKITFEDAAKENSEDPGTKERGGDLGFIKRGIMVKEFEDAAFALKTGEMSEPVKSTYGYHIIRAEKLGKDSTGDERKDLMERIRQERLRPEMNNWYMKVKQEAKVIRKFGEQPPPPPMMGMPAEKPKPKPAPKPAAKPAAKPEEKPAEPAKAEEPATPQGEPAPPADQPEAPAGGEDATTQPPPVPEG